MKLTTYAAFTILCVTLSSSAFAGCGKESRFNLPNLTTSDHALVRQAIIPDAEQPGPGKGDAAGLWLTTVSIEGQPVFQAFEAFTGDGLEFLNDNGSPIEGNVCFGYWTSTGKNIKVIHPAWNYDMNGNLIGTVVITSNVTLDPDGNTFKGNVSVEAFDMNGVSEGVILQAALTGKRLSS